MKSVKQLLRCLVSTAILFAVARPVGATCGDWLQHNGSENQHLSFGAQAVRAGQGYSADDARLSLTPVGQSLFDDAFQPGTSTDRPQSWILRQVLAEPVVLLMGQVSSQHGTRVVSLNKEATKDASAFDFEKTSSHPTKRPCDGPSCGRAPKAPAAASDSIVTLRRVVDGDLVEAMACPDHQYEGYLRDVSAPKRLAGFPLSILRPPMA